MKHPIIISICLLLSINCIAQKHKIKKGKNTKLDYEYYVDQYGTNDTSIAIIELFFDKRNNVAIGKMSFLPVSASVTIIAPPIGVGLSIIASPLFVSGMLTQHKYSHKNLLITLKHYHNNNLISEKFKKQIVGKLKQNKEIHQDEIKEERLMALRQIKTYANLTN